MLSFPPNPLSSVTERMYPSVSFSLGGAHRAMIFLKVNGLRSRRKFRQYVSSTFHAARYPYAIVSNCTKLLSVWLIRAPFHRLVEWRMFRGLLLRCPLVMVVDNFFEWLVAKKLTDY